MRAYFSNAKENDSVSIVNQASVVVSEKEIREIAKRMDSSKEGDTITITATNAYIKFFVH